MKPVKAPEIYFHLEYGTVLQCFDIEIADEFEDFLNDNLDKDFQLKFEIDNVSFFFGKELSVFQIRELYEKFEAITN